MLDALLVNRYATFKELFFAVSIGLLAFAASLDLNESYYSGFTRPK